MATVKTSFTYKLDQGQQQALERILRSGNYQPREVPYTVVAVEAEKCNVSLYTSGKCLVQGKGAADWITFVLEPQVLKTATLGYEEVLDPESLKPHMGVDESGKGDFFGPLVIASAYVDQSIIPQFKELDVKDSKNIKSDKKALAIASKIRGILGKRFSLVAIGPNAYNRLYASMGNVNRVLAWGHARVIENLLEVVPACPRAIADQFGPKQRIEQALMKKGRAIELIQRTKAESDIAVAAASILARAAFLEALRKMSEKYAIKIPKGASAQVREIAEKMVEQHGPQMLLETVKCHFRTTDQVLAARGMDRSVLEQEKLS